MSETKTVGTIGQMYENRKTGKIGKLIETNDKFKTLLMESPDGETFNISFASLKSNWRKAKEEPVEAVVNDEDVTNLTVADDALAENPNIIAFEEIPKVKKNTDKDSGTMFVNSVSSVTKLMGAIDDPSFRLGILSSRRAFALKIGRANVVEIYTRTFKGAFEFFMKDDFFRDIKWSPEVKPNSYDVQYHPDYRLTTHFLVNKDNIEIAINDIIPELKKLVEAYNIKVETNKKED